MQIRAVSLPKDCVYSWPWLCFRNTPAGELVICSWSLSDVLSFVFSELGSNPLNSAGIDEGAFADLKRVSYIRIADTNITEIPKGTALISVWTNQSLICHFGFITSHTRSRQSAFYARLKCFPLLYHCSNVWSYPLLPFCYRFNHRMHFQVCLALSLSFIWIQTRSPRWRPPASRVWRIWPSNRNYYYCYYYCWPFELWVLNFPLLLWYSKRGS